MNNTTWQVGDKVCLTPTTGDNEKWNFTSKHQAYDCGEGEVTAVFFPKENAVTVKFPNGSVYTKSDPNVFETPESTRKRREEEQGAIRLKKFNEKYNRSAA